MGERTVNGVDWGPRCGLGMPADTVAPSDIDAVDMVLSRRMPRRPAAAVVPATPVR
jgi:hypothetical protein